MVQHVTNDVIRVPVSIAQSIGLPSLQRDVVQVVHRPPTWFLHPGLNIMNRSKFKGLRLAKRKGEQAKEQQGNGECFNAITSSPKVLVFFPQLSVL
jgi:hypothetical protein